MKAILRSVSLALAIMTLAVPASAGPFEDAVAAYLRGDYATALREWRPWILALALLAYLFDVFDRRRARRVISTAP